VKDNEKKKSSLGRRLNRKKALQARFILKNERKTRHLGKGGPMKEGERSKIPEEQSTFHEVA